MKTKTKIKPENFTFSRTKKKFGIQYKDAVFYERTEGFLFKGSYPFFESENFKNLNDLSLSLIEAYFDYAKKKKSGNVKIVFQFATDNYLSLLIYTSSTCRSINYLITEREVITPKEVFKIQGIKRKNKKIPKGYKVIKDTVHFCHNGIKIFAQNKHLQDNVLIKLENHINT